jgi:hypothetical protein
MLWALLGAIGGACMGVARWKYRAVRVPGRFFPHQGSAQSLILNVMAFAAICALVLLGADAVLNRQPDEQASASGALPHRLPVSAGERATAGRVLPAAPSTSLSAAIGETA